MSNLIYGYKKKDTNKIVYIGQTVNLEARHKQHIDYDPYNKNNKEYNYPLSRGIRKYGKNAYELIIIEDNLEREDLNNREIFWINYYNTYYDGYNQSLGGSNPVTPIITDDTINYIIELLKDESNSFQDIHNKTGVSITHIYNINTGKRRKKENLSYPIRSNKAKGTKGLKISQQDNNIIHDLLLNSPMSMKEISEIFNCNVSTISRINKGSTKSYQLKNYLYPLRKNN